MIFFKKVWQPALEEVIKKHVIVERLKGASLEVLFSLVLLAGSGFALYTLEGVFAYVLAVLLMLVSIVFTYFITFPKSMESYLKQYGRDEISEMKDRMNKIILYSDQTTYPGLLPSDYRNIASGFLACLDEILTLLNGTMTNYRTIQSKYIDSGLKKNVIEFSAVYRELTQERAIEGFRGRASDHFDFTNDVIYSCRNHAIQKTRLKNLILMNLREADKLKRYTYKDGYRRIELGESVVTPEMKCWLLGLPVSEEKEKFMICEILELPATKKRTGRDCFKTPVKN